MFQSPDASNHSSCPVFPDFQLLQLSDCYGNTSIVLASRLVRVPNSIPGYLEDMSLNPFVALTQSGKTLGVRTLLSGDPDVMCEHAAGVIICSSQSVWLRNTGSLALHWQTHLPNATADNTSLLNQAHEQYQSSTGGSIVEKPAKTIRLTSSNLTFQLE